MLRSEPGILLETVAGTMTMGTQNSSYFPRAVNNSSSDRKACKGRAKCFSVLRTGGAFCRVGWGAGWFWVGATCHEEGKGQMRRKCAKGRSQAYHNGKQRKRQIPLYVHLSLCITHTNASRYTQYIVLANISVREKKKKQRTLTGLCETKSQLQQTWTVNCHYD